MIKFETEFNFKTTYKKIKVSDDKITGSEDKKQVKINLNIKELKEGKGSSCTFFF